MHRLLATTALALSILQPASAAEIHTAAARGDVEAVRSLLESDPSLRVALDEMRRTPFHWAVMQDQADLWPLLLTDENLDRPDRMGLTPLFLAITNQSPEAVAWLLEQGADVDARKPGDLLTPLHWAAEQRRSEAVSLLLEHGASTSARNLAGSTPLHVAAKLGAAEVVGVLLAAGADPDAGNLVGLTPVMLAAAGNRLETVELLLAKGADPALRDRRGKPALDYALELDNPEVAEALRKAAEDGG